MSRITTLLFALGLLTIASVQAEDIFLIEVVYFAQDESAALSDFRHGQRLPEPAAPDFSDLQEITYPVAAEAPEDSEAPSETVNEAFMRGLFDEEPQAAQTEPAPLPLRVLLTDGEGSLDGLVQQLHRHGAITVLDHQRWYQTASPFERPRFLRVHDGRDHRPPPATRSEQPTEPSFWDDGLVEPADPPQHQPTYRLDGRVAFTRGNYFHLWLDLVYRQPVPADLPWAQRTAAGIESIEFLHHRLDERRRLSLNEWQYYDSPHLGAVAVVRRYRPNQ